MHTDVKMEEGENFFPEFKLEILLDIVWLNFDFFCVV